MQNSHFYERFLNYFVPVFSKPKLSVLFAIICTIYLVLYTTRPSLSCACKPCSCKTNILCNVSYSATKNSTSMDENKNYNYNLRHVATAFSNEELEFLLNIRKLILFSVHELNKPLKDTDCVKWWANPLDLIFSKPILNSDTHITHKIRFILQPGNIIHLQVEIRQKRIPINVNDTELEIVRPFKFLNAPVGIFGPCKNNESVFTETLRKTCICLLRPEVAVLEAATEAAMKIWKLMDPELPTWKPKDSFMIEDYMNFTDYEWFIKSPENTTNEVRDRKFSSEYCGPKLKMLVMISSAPSHFNQRKIIRKTFASPKNLEGKGIKVLFLMGIPTNPSQMTEVLIEEEEFKDIIVANYHDSYHNLSLSHLSMYNWMQLTCGNGQTEKVTLPKFLLKADDDFLLNLDLALRVAEANPDAELIGCLFCGTKAVRDTAKELYHSKYYTPKYMHISGSYAGYFNGIAYLLRTDVIPRFLHMSTTTPFIHMDDVYVTGILSRQLQIYPRNAKVFTSARIKPDACNSKTVINSQVYSPEDLMEQWNQFVKPIPSNCDLNNLPIKIEILTDEKRQQCFYD